MRKRVTEVIDDERIHRIDEKASSVTIQVYGVLTALAAVVLLLLQGTILRWSLTPLRRAARDLEAIQSGVQARLEGGYPGELQGLTDNLNALLESERRQLGRYRDGLADLAHSLKTPLAVLRGALEGGNDEELRGAVKDQTERMNLIVDYQLQRAATSGRTALMAPVPIEPVVRRVLDSLAKVYRDKDVRSEQSVPQDACFHGDEGDLMELLGNLIDNAYKWCRSVVRVNLDVAPARELVLTVEDDGPGVPAAERSRCQTPLPGSTPNTTVPRITPPVKRPELTSEPARSTRELMSL